MKVYRIVKEGGWYYVEYKWLFCWVRDCWHYDYYRFGCIGAAEDHIKKLEKETTV